MAALTQGRLARFRDPRNRIAALQFVAILDARTSDVCRPRDGLILRLDDERVAANTPPLHINCRSTWSPILSWDLAALEGGDERLERSLFNWLKDPNAPKNLEEALRGWDKVEKPLPGFEGVGEKRKPAKVKGSDGTPPGKPPAPPEGPGGGGTGRLDPSGGGSFEPVKRESIPESRIVVRRLFDERRINIEYTALKYSEPDVRSAFGNRLKNVEVTLEKSLSRFPPKLLEVVEQSEHGIIMVTHEIARQRGARLSRLSGAYHRKSGQILLTTWAIDDDRGVAKEEFIHLIDHLLGSNGKGKNLSEGSFVKTSLAQLAQKIGNLYETVNLSSYSRTNPREWLAQAVRFYLSFPEELRELDPEVYSLMERWFSNDYWESVL